MAPVGSDSAGSNAEVAGTTVAAGAYEQQYAGYYPMYGRDYTYTPAGLGSAAAFVGGSPPAPLSPVTGGFAMVGGAAAGQYYYAMSGSPTGSPPLGPLVGSPPLGPLLGPAGAGIGAGARTGTSDAVDPRNVYIRNLNEDCTDTTLARLAEPYGEIESSKSILHEATGKCKGYGFVKYRTEEQAARAIEAFSAQGLHSTLARDSFKAKLKRLQDNTSTNVYVSNLPADVDEAALTALVRPHAVLSARILRHAQTGQHKGAGFVRMADRDTALAVIEHLKSVRLPNAPGPLIPRIADSQGQKLLKKHANTDTRAHDEFRASTTSPLMWSPVLVYSPAASPPPPQAHDAHRIPSPSFAPGRLSPGMFVAGYASPYASPPHTGYASPPHAGYVSPPHAGYASPPHAGYASSPPTSYASPPYAGYTPSQPAGYVPPHPAGYASPLPMYTLPVEQPQQLRRPPSGDHAVGDLASAIQDNLAL